MVLEKAGPGRMMYGEEEVKEVMDVLSSGHLYRYGLADEPEFKHKVVSFEEEFKKILGAKYCVAVVNGTSALLAGLSALGIGPGDEVIVPGYTFMASMVSIIYARAIPVLAEVDDSLTIDPIDIEKKITKKTKAIMPVHLSGNPCAMDKIMDIAKKHNLFVIEDCATIAGGSYKGKRLGNYGNISAFSLNFVKIISCGDGGAVVTNDLDLYERAFGFHDHGHKPSRLGEKVGERVIFGLNLRMNELTGAVALAQVRKLDTILSTLRTKKKKLKDMLRDIPNIGFRRINDEEGEAATLLTLLFDDKERAERFAAKIGVKTLINSGWHVYNNMEAILEQKTPTEFKCPFECPVYGQKVEYRKHMLPQTDDILSRAVNLSVGVVDIGLGATFGINILSSDEEIEAVAQKVKQFMKEI